MSCIQNRDIPLAIGNAKINIASGIVPLLYEPARIKFVQAHQRGESRPELAEGSPLETPSRSVTLQNAKLAF